MASAGRSVRAADSASGVRVSPESRSDAAKTSVAQDRIYDQMRSRLAKKHITNTRTIKKRTHKSRTWRYIELALPIVCRPQCVEDAEWGALVHA